MFLSCPRKGSSKPLFPPISIRTLGNANFVHANLWTIFAIFARAEPLFRGQSLLWIDPSWQRERAMRRNEKEKFCTCQRARGILQRVAPSKSNRPNPSFYVVVARIPYLSIPAITSFNCNGVRAPSLRNDSKHLQMPRSRENKILSEVSILMVL